VGNCNFEVTQRNCGANLVNPGSGIWIEDRYHYIKNGSANVNLQVGSNVFPNAIVVPGTNFQITRNYLMITNQAVVSLAAGDYCAIRQYPEGPVFRELANDVHSFSILARSNVAGLSFGLTLTDPTGTRSLAKLCTVSAANTFQLITLPNLPIWPTSGTFSIAPGSQGYTIVICLAAGSTYIASANDTWQNANTLGAVGQSNFCGQPIGTNLQLFFLQHEPGPVCTTPIDCPYSQNLHECLRYYHKTFQYSTVPGSSTGLGGNLNLTMISNPSWGLTSYGFPRPMAKQPTGTAYDANNGVINSIWLWNSASTHIGVSSVACSDKDLSMVQVATAQTVPAILQGHFTFDSGW
jgi:hypothetical protein